MVQNGPASNNRPAAASVHDDPRFAPYTRRDRYGHLGMAPLQQWERIRLIAMSVLVVPARLLLAMAFVVVTHVLCRVSDFLPKHQRGDWCARVCRFCCTAACIAMGLNVVWVKVPSQGDEEKPAGIVSNHCSWADILIHLAHNCPSFAARDGTQKLPLIGSISERIQCLYVNRDAAQGVSSAIKDRMLSRQRDPHHHDRPMLLFPEGTTTNGRYLLNFKTGAFLAGLPLQPVLIQYDQLAPVSPCWDTINPVRHLWLMLCQPMHNVTCYELPVYSPSPQEKLDPALYAGNMRQYMLGWGRKLGMELQPSDSTFAMKLEYHTAVRILQPPKGPRSHQKEPSESTTGLVQAEVLGRAKAD